MVNPTWMGNNVNQAREIECDNILLILNLTPNAQCVYSSVTNFGLNHLYFAIIRAKKSITILESVEDLKQIINSTPQKEGLSLDSKRMKDWFEKKVVQTFTDTIINNISTIKCEYHSINATKL
jgi:hypothetical protein